MLQVFLPYVIAAGMIPMVSEAAFCVGPCTRPIAFTTPEKVENFVQEAQSRLGITLSWGIANDLEFPGLHMDMLNIDPELPPVFLADRFTRDRMVALLPEPVLSTT